MRHINTMFATVVAEIGDGVKLTDEELQLTEFIFVTKEEAEI